MQHIPTDIRFGRGTLQKSGSYVYPFGIPAASFGIAEPNPGFPSAGAWTSEIPGTYCIDGSTGDDTGRTFGSFSLPRKTVPNTLAAGSKVLVKGTYTNPHTSPNNFVLNGTSSSPVWIVNIGNWTAAVQVKGSYGIFSGVTLGKFYSIVALDTCDHLAFREFEVAGNLSGGGLGVAQFGSGTVNDIVFYKLYIHDCGDATNLAVNPDLHGITINWGTNIWVLECEMARCAGDGIQVAAGNPTFGYADPAQVGRVNGFYFGRNKCYSNQQHGIWVKYATTGVLSQNECYGHTENSFGIGAQIGCQYGPQELFVLLNTLKDGHRGFGASSYTIPGNLYVIGNNVFNIRYPGGTMTNVNNGAGLFFAGGTNIIANDNNIQYCDAGVHLPAGPSFFQMKRGTIQNIVRATFNIDGTPVTDIGPDVKTDHPWNLVTSGVLSPQP